MLNKITEKKIIKLDFVISSLISSSALIFTLIFCYLLLAFEKQSNKISFYKALIEYFYYFSQILIFIVAVIGLIQFIFLIEQTKLSKADIEIRTKREARVLALQICESFKKEIFPKLVKINKFIDEREIPKIDIKSKEEKNEDLKILIENWFSEWFISIKFIIPDINSTLNELDIFSSYFIKELADEETAFKLIGPKYCKAIEDLFVFITYTRIIDSTFDHYYNISNLNEIWTNKLKNLDHFKLDPLGSSITEYINNETKR